MRFHKTMGRSPQRCCKGGGRRGGGGGGRTGTRVRPTSYDPNYVDSGYMGVGPKFPPELSNLSSRQMTPEITRQIQEIRQQQISASHAAYGFHKSGAQGNNPTYAVPGKLYGVVAPAGEDPRPYIKMKYPDFEIKGGPIDPRYLRYE